MSAWQKMQSLSNSPRVDIENFLNSGFSVRAHLAHHLKLTLEQVDQRLPEGKDDLAAMHPGAFQPDQATEFYESTVGTGHLFELAAWHLSSSDYIADTLRLQEDFARGVVLDFGGGIGTHALAAAALKSVDRVHFVDLNPQNRAFVWSRAVALGLEQKISVHRDLGDLNGQRFDTILCLDVLEHLPDPSDQLLQFYNLMNSDGRALLNWYFFKGYNDEYPFHFDDPNLVDSFFQTLQTHFLEVFHPLLITTRVYRPLDNNSSS
jgi:SAM-dependent methyltransferase